MWGSSSILSFRNYNHEKRCTKGGAVLSCISFHLSARRPPPLLPAARKGLRLRFGEQKVHTRRRRKTLYRRRAGHGLCSPPPAKAYGLVSGSKIFTQGGGGNRFIAGSPAGAFAPRRPQRLTASFRGAKSSHRAAAKIALSPARRPAPLLPPPAKAYGSVLGSKKFTQGGSGKRFIAGSPAGAFAPRRPQRLTASYRGAKSSHKAAAEIALSPARRPPTLLPAARKGLRLRFGEQKVHRGRRRKSLYCRRAGRRLCSPPPAKAYGSVSGSKKFTQSGGGKRLIAGSPAAAFAPRRPQRLTASFRGAKSSHRAAAEIALSPARRPAPLLPAARKGLRLRFEEQKVHTRRRRKSRYARRQ